MNKQLSFNEQLNLVAVSATPEPFLKWPGGKRSVLDQYKPHLPPALLDGSIKRYVEPFLGGGSVFFWMTQQGHSLDEYIINDINPDLMLTYRVVRDQLPSLIEYLQQLQDEYWPKDEEERKAFYLAQRIAYNESRPNNYKTLRHRARVARAARLIFLNRTCFNGLYRVNSKGEFNVAHGRYKKPTICNEQALRAAHEALQLAVVLEGDFEHCARYVGDKTLVYVDPPYRAKFSRYAAGNFTEKDQKRLARFLQESVERGSKVMAANSKTDDAVLRSLYENWVFKEILANRRISRKASSRGKKVEWLIKSYGKE